MNSFNFKGISSDNFNIIVNFLPPISKPAMRVEETEIDGVDGIIFEDLGYESYEKKIKITITKNNVDEIIKWLNGEGDLVLSNEPDKYYKAKVIEQIDFESLIKYEPIEVTFRVQPFKYEYLEEQVVLPSEKVAGEVIQLTDKKINEFSVEGGENNSIKITGKNELDFAKITSGPDTVVTQIANGVNSQGKWYVQYPVKLDKGLWSVSYNYEVIDGTITSATGMWRVMFEDGTYSQVIESGKSFEITKEIKGILFYSSNGTTVASVNFTNIQLERGNVTNYEPYKEMILTTDEILKQPLFDGVNNISNSANANMVITYVDNKMLVDNVGNYIAKPVIAITGTGTIELIVNGKKSFNYTFPDGENAVVIDSEKQDAYLGLVLKNRNMNGEFPIFEIGENTITWEGNISSIKITSKSRWL